MIYNTNLFKKEMRASYLKTEHSRNQRFLTVFLLGLAVIIFHTMLLTAENTVITDNFPFLVESGYFSVAVLFKLTSFFFSVIYLLLNYRTATFAEIRQDRWYLLRKMGHSITKLILTKIGATLLNMLLIYCGGFIISMILTGIYGYQIQIVPLLILFVCGLVDIFCLTLIVLLFSLLFHTSDNAAWSIVITAGLMIAYQVFSGYFGIITDADRLQTFSAILVSPYMYVELAAIILSFFLCTSIASRISQTYSLNSTYEAEFVKDYKTQEIRQISRREINTGRLMSNLVFGVATVVVALACLVNVLMFLLASRTEDDEYQIAGFIPYIMQTDTLHGVVEENDLVFFTSVESPEQVAVDDVVLFHYSADQPQGTIEQVTAIDNGVYCVDVTNYENMEADTLRFYLQIADIDGVMAWRSRALGAYIVFANSSAGRILMLIVPLLILIFYDRIEEYGRGRKARTVDM